MSERKDTPAGANSQPFECVQQEFIDLLWFPCVYGLACEFCDVEEVAS